MRHWKIHISTYWSMQIKKTYSIVLTVIVVSKYNSYCHSFTFLDFQTVVTCHVIIVLLLCVGIALKKEKVQKNQWALKAGTQTGRSLCFYENIIVEI